MALAGLNRSRSSLWCEMVSSLSRQLDNPYLRAMFTFMTSTDATSYMVLKEAEMQIEDRIGFACLYLNDQHLSEYLEQLSTSIIRNGNLAGVLVTGLTKGSGLELLQSYLDHTCDVQSVSCVVLHASELIRDKKVEQWMQIYRRLLDTWRLWHQRAKFDMFLHAIDSRKKVPEQTYVHCHFCSSPVSPSLLSSRSIQSGGSHMRFGGRGQSTLKPKACYVCRKPLPRCSLCQMNMGTTSGTSKLLPQRNKSSKALQSSTGGGDNAVKASFDVWFTWCQSCRHGGHGCHLRDWFSTHSECPVTGCACKCMQLDTVGAFPALDSMDT
ncbi:putative WD repeat-containing protein mio [Apostichopus japonicus]|uniref:Putative WD repeat-containing protein mio n=1 Tax=Stichopus japonicus TaxID=307972 RepID=A0A2G8L0U3_STIJA|nr:putative WD repeat-containing protein mio [Apostichopus japonicus]